MELSSLKCNSMMQVRWRGALNSMLEYNRARHMFLKCDVRKKVGNLSCRMKVRLDFLSSCFSFKHNMESYFSIRTDTH